MQIWAEPSVLSFPPMEVILIVVIVVVVILLAAVAVGSAFMFGVSTCRNFHSGGHYTPSEDYTARSEKAREALAAYTYEDVSIESRDGLVLRGRYWHSPSPKRTVVFAHGFRSTGEYDSTLSAPLYLKNGCELLVIDQRACASSEGKYMTFGALEKYDLVMWAEYANSRGADKMPMYFSGVSMGGATVVLASALELPKNVIGLVDDCGYESISAIMRHVLKKWFKMPPFPLEYTTSLFIRLFARYNMYADSSSALKAAAASTLPLLIIHGGKDDFVPTEMSRRVYAASASRDKRLVIVDEAEHALSFYIDPEKVGGELLSFFERCENNQPR